MNESTLPIPLGSSTLASTAAAGSVLTVNTEGGSSWQAPAGGASGTAGADTSTGPYNPVTINADSGIITMPLLSGTDMQALFEVNNDKVTNDSVILLTVINPDYFSNGVICANITQINPGRFSILLVVANGSVFNSAVKVHFLVVNNTPPA